MTSLSTSSLIDSALMLIDRCNVHGPFGLTDGDFVADDLQSLVVEATTLREQLPADTKSLSLHAVSSAAPASSADSGAQHPIVGSAARALTGETSSQPAGSSAPATADATGANGTAGNRGPFAS